MRRRHPITWRWYLSLALALTAFAAGLAGEMMLWLWTMAGGIVLGAWEVLHDRRQSRWWLE